MDDTFYRKLEFGCPFCTQRVEAGHDDAGRWGLLHVTPMCGKFEELSPEDFIAEIGLSSVDDLKRIGTAGSN